MLPDQEQERAELESLRKSRENREAFASMSEAERQEYDNQIDPRQWFAQARRQEEEEFTAQVQREYEQELRTNSSGMGNINQRGKVREKAQANMQAKLQAWQQARELRELQAERQDDELDRLLYSLSDRGRTIVRELIGSRPDPMQRIAAAKQATQTQAREGLKEQYIREMQASVKNGFIPAYVARGIRAKYEGMGLRTGAPDVVNDLMQAVRR